MHQYTEPFGLSVVGTRTAVQSSGHASRQWGRNSSAQVRTTI